MFRCSGCKRKQQLATGTFVEGAHVPLHKLVAIIYFWATDTSVGQTTDHVSMSSRYMYLRDICSWKLLRTPIQLGGTDKVVQIDESVMVKAKYHHGHQLREKQWWVFGVYDPELKEGFIQLVEQRDAATLLPIIQRVVRPGTTIWSRRVGVGSVPAAFDVRLHTPDSEPQQEFQGPDDWCVHKPR